MRLTDFLASVGRDFHLQSRFWQSDVPQLRDDRFRQVLGHHGFDRLHPDHQGILERGDLTEIKDVLEREAKEGGDGGGSSAEVTAHQFGGFGPCWVLVRI